MAIETAQTESEADVPTRPDIYYDWAPSGWYPIIAFRSVPCDRFALGQCAPCMYSARPRPRVARARLYASLLDQIDWVLDNFANVVARRQSGRLPGYRLRQAPKRPWYLFQLSGESSFLRDAEVPRAQRSEILERLLAFQESAQVNLHVMIESRPEHIVEAERRGELERLRPLFRELDVVVNMGFEAHDGFIRNVVFDKALDSKVFEQAMAIAAARGLDPAAFLFAGGYPLSDAEILNEVRNSLEFLNACGGFANVMVPNLQSYTIQDVLYEAGHYALPEPFLVLELAALLVDFAPRRRAPITPFSWFLGGIESDPAPRMNLFTNPGRRTSDTVSEQIYATVRDLVIYGDRTKFLRELETLRRTKEGTAYQEMLARTPTESLPVRVAKALASAEAAIDAYDQRLRRELAVPEPTAC